MEQIENEGIEKSRNSKIGGKTLASVCRPYVPRRTWTSSVRGMPFPLFLTLFISNFIATIEAKFQSSSSSHKDKHGSLYIQVVCAVDTDTHTNTDTYTYTDCKHSMSSSFRRRTAVPGTGAGTRNPRGRIGGGPLSSSSQSPAVHVPVPVPVLELVGTKPWVGGATLTSSGLREFDAILGGGQPLGTAMLIEEDRWTQDLALALVRYWAAEVST